MSTNQEYVLADTDLIVSKTDLKGVITYVNDDFIRIGGFSRTELIGKPHNILRHPDMPKAAFEDLWKTLKSGNSWTGIVNNQMKNGGFYWVRANIMPLFEQGKIVAYLSVRNKPSAAEIAAASKLYKEMQAGRSRIKLDAGEVIEPNLTKAIVRTFSNITIKTKLITLVTLSLLSLGGIAGYGSYGLGYIQSVTEKNITEVEEHAKGMNLSRSAQVDFKTQVQEFKNSLIRGQNPEAFAKYVKAFDEQSEKVDKNLRALSELMADMPEKDIVALPTAALEHHIEVTKKYRAALQAYQSDNVASIFTVDALVKGIDRSFIDDVDKLVAFNQSEIEKHIGEGKAISSNVVEQFQNSVTLIGLLIASILLTWSIATLLSILRPIKRASELMVQVAEGQQVQVNEFSKNELGQIMQAIKNMGIKFGFEAAEDKRTAREMLRIKMALDEVRIPVTLSNSQKELIYMNTAAQMLWNDMSETLAKRLPNFTVQGMLGQPVGQYLETEEDREHFAKHDDAPITMIVNLGGKKLRLTVLSIYDANKNYVGRATQWKDITAELAMQRQISDIVKDATSGNFRNRVNVTEKEGFFRKLADGLNLLLETCEKSYTDIADIFDALSHGDLTHKITTQYTGEFDTIKNDANYTVDKLTEIVEQIKSITRNVNEGSKEIAASNADLSDRTTSQASALEETAASMHELNSTVQTNTENANDANTFVVNTSDIASKGVQVIGRVVHTMEDIRESSRKVVDIISVIDGISFQTNILALNAAVEAARAGEQGRGFAVVATEVRSLAQRAATAAGEIKMLINDSVEKIEDGSKLVVDAGHTMEEIVSSIHTVTKMISGISAASNEQSSGIGQANSAILNMEEMTQQNAALVEQSAATADNLKNQAVALSSAVDYFKFG